MSRRVALGVSYRGQAYHGWQSQSSLKTVQDALEAGLKACERFAAVPPLAFALTKSAMNHSYHTLEACFRAEQDYQPVVGLSRDHKESVAAFLEKRKPNYTGE